MNSKNSNEMFFVQFFNNKIIQSIWKQQGLEPLLNYCFQHADRPNPLQDLIDKGLMPTKMTGITCVKVSQMNAEIQNQILDLENKINEVLIK